MAEPDTSEADEADKEPQTEERRQYEELHFYLLREDYPPGATKAEKGVIRKRAKKFELVDGILHYGSVGKDGQSRLKEVFVIIMRVAC